MFVFFFCLVKFNELNCVHLDLQFTKIFLRLDSDECGPLFGHKENDESSCFVGQAFPF